MSWETGSAKHEKNTYSQRDGVHSGRSAVVLCRGDDIVDRLWGIHDSCPGLHTQP